jgi:hypothetical protein
LPRIQKYLSRINGVNHRDDQEAQNHPMLAEVTR